MVAARSTQEVKGAHHRRLAAGFIWTRRDRWVPAAATSRLRHMSCGEGGSPSPRAGRCCSRRVFSKQAREGDDLERRRRGVNLQGATVQCFRGAPRPMWGKSDKTDGEVPSSSPQEKQVRHGSGALTQGCENRAMRGPLKILMRW